jgi:hypothetical protein
MASLTIKGTGIVTSADFKNVVWTGKTKSGKAVSITLANAINVGNIDLTMVEKDDTVAQIVFSAAYTNTDYMVASTADYTEPWTISYAGAAADTAAGTILLGAGVVSIGGVDVALTRGGSQFTVEREFREINADGDRGAVKDRVVMDASRATLTLNALSFLTNMANAFSAISVTTSS